MREVGTWVVIAIVAAVLVGKVVLTTEYKQEMQAKWDRERDSLKTANAMLTIRFDSARAESIAHQQRAESLATVPRTIYIANATRLTSGAPLDSLGILFFADPFVAVPDTLLDHHEP